MPITATVNAQYDPTGPVSQKYTPLDGRQNIPNTLTVGNNDNIVTQLIGFRQQMFRNLTRATAPPNAAPYNVSIKYWGQNITNVLTEEKNKANAAQTSVPPIAVISSNRSGWIRDRCIAGSTWRMQNPQVALTGISDGIILNVPPGGAGSVPIYAPYRIGTINNQERGVYIFVHRSEYQTYRNNLNNIAGIKVIGWDFPALANGEAVGSTDMFGFGISRYAAMEFFKHLHIDSDAANVCNKIWMIDDNVVYLTGRQNLGYFEQQMPDANPPYGISFMGDNAPAQAYANPYPNPNNPLPFNWNPNNNPVLLQQMMLWNVAYLVNNSYDFSPYFITAGEDISFTRYNLRHTPASCCIDNQFRIKKISLLPQDHDNTQERAAIEFGRDIQLRHLSYRARNVPINPQAVPLSTFLGGLPQVAQNEPLHKTSSKAVEQILRTGIAQGVLANNVLLPYDSMFNIRVTAQFQNT
jgi:hypothetical protein